MRNWGLSVVSLFSLTLVASGLACGRTGLLLLDEDPGTAPGDVGDSGVGVDGSGPDADGGVVPNSIDAALIAVGDAELADDQQIATGEGHACLRTTAGEVYCWGNNTLGQVGDGTKIDRPTAKKVEGLPLIVRVATGLPPPTTRRAAAREARTGLVAREVRASREPAPNSQTRVKGE